MIEARKKAAAFTFVIFCRASARSALPSSPPPPPPKPKPSSVHNNCATANKESIYTFNASVSPLNAKFNGGDKIFQYDCQVTKGGKECSVLTRPSRFSQPKNKKNLLDAETNKRVNDLMVPLLLLLMASWLRYGQAAASIAFRP